MKISDIEIVLAKYVNAEMLPVMPTTLSKFSLVAASTLMIGKTEKLIEKHKDIIQTLGIIDNEGNVDVDALYVAAKEGMKASNGRLEIKSFTFNQADIDKLYKMLKEGN